MERVFDGFVTAGGSGATPSGRSVRMTRRSQPRRDERDKPHSPPMLNERERRFVEAYMGAAAGNATKAARLAGYSTNTADKHASRLLRKVGIQQAIDQRAKTDPAVWTREDRLRFWTAVASGRAGFAKASLRDRLKASELLGKSQADFVERVEHSGKLTLLEEALTASRQAGASDA
jgi:phage terminase small subunit